MPDEVTPEATAQAQGAEPAAAEGPKYVTSDDLRSFRDGLFADIRKVTEGIVNKPRGGAAREATEQQAASPPGDYQAAIRREREISEAFDDIGGISREGKSILRRLVDAEKPDNVSDFISLHAKAFGRPSDPTQPTTPARPPAASGHPASDRGSPAAASASVDDGTPLVHMKPEDRAHFIKTKGLHAYATRLRAELKGVRVSMRNP